MKLKDIISIILLLSTAVACQKNNLPQRKGTVLEFASSGTKSGLSDNYGNFKVWATSHSDVSETTIMDGYRVNYDPASGWTYTSGEGTGDQELKFWELSATSYSFHAGAPASKVNGIDVSSLTLSLVSTTSLAEASLYSEPYLVKRNDPLFGHVVMLNFIYANARVNLAFKYPSSTQHSIKNIKLIPISEASSYTTEAELRVDYDWGKLSATAGTMSRTSTSREAISFPDVDIPAETMEAVATAEPRYMIPDYSVTGQWRLSLEIDGETRQVDFTITKTWESGKSYLYRFEYTDGSSLVFIGTSTEMFVGEDLQEGGDHNFS